MAGLYLTDEIRKTGKRRNRKDEMDRKRKKGLNDRWILWNKESIQKLRDSQRIGL